MEMTSRMVLAKGLKTSLSKKKVTCRHQGANLTKRGMQIADKQEQITRTDVVLSPQE